MVSQFLNDTQTIDSFERRATWRVLEAARERNLGGYVATDWHQLDLAGSNRDAYRASPEHHQGVASVLIGFACWLGVVGLVDVEFSASSINAIVSDMPPSEMLSSLADASIDLLTASEVAEASARSHGSVAGRSPRPDGARGRDDDTSPPRTN